MTPDPHDGSRPARALLALAVAAAGTLLAVPSIPLLASRPATAAAPSPEAPPPPKAPPPTRPGEATSREGQEYFLSRDAGPAKVACADCHLIQDPKLAPPDDLVRPGHNLWDAFGRGSWWNSRITTDCGDAAEVCLKRFQGAAEMEPRKRVALVLFMRSHSAPVTVPMILQRRPASFVNVNEGDAERGRDVFRRACALCHPGGAAAASGIDMKASRLSRGEIVEIVRDGRERMPFFQGDLLSDAEVADVAAYTWSLQPANAGN